MIKNQFKADAVLAVAVYHMWLQRNKKIINRQADNEVVAPRIIEHVLLIEHVSVRIQFHPKKKRKKRVETISIVLFVPFILFYFVQINKCFFTFC